MEDPKPEGASRRSQSGTAQSLSLGKIKHFDIISPIGKGGMGEVFLAFDTKLDRKVAVKFLPESLHRDTVARERFLREAKAAAALDHPFICKIYEAGEFQGKAYIVMEYVEGKNLRDRIAESPLPIADALRAALEVAEALEAAHGKGIVHRDLKPSNLMCTPQGHIKVMDFGLAKHIVQEPETGTATATLTQTAGQPSITGQGMVVGTLAYMSPEQARGEVVDARTDIFSLGVTLIEMVTGTHPFDRPTPLETVTAVLRDNPPPLHVKPKVANPSLERIVHKALAKDPAARYQGVSEMAADLRALEIDVAPRKWLGFRSWPVLAGSVVGVAAVLTVGAWLLLGPRKPKAPPPAPKPVKVLIADFENKTGDAVFDGALEQTFGISLEAASFVTLYDRGQARKLAGQLNPGSAGRLDRESALLVSRREGINVVVGASIEPSRGGAGFTFKAEAVDPVSSERISESSESIPTKAEVLRAADHLATKLRASLEGVPSGSIRQASMETFTAASLEAMKAYARAQDLTSMGQDEEAIREYLKAVGIDPQLGRAYAGLAVIYRNRGEIDEARKYYEKAMGLLDQMTDREKYRTRGGYFLVNRNYRKAIEEFGALRTQFPLDDSGFINLPLSHFFARDMPKAFEEGRKAVDAFPGMVNPRYNLTWYAIGADRLDVAETEARKVIELDSGFAEAYVCLGLIRLMQGRDAEAAVEYRRLEGLGTYAASFGAAGLADLALYLGRNEEARGILEKAIPADLKSGLKARATHKRILLAELLVVQGRKAEALRVIEAIPPESLDETVLFSAALVGLGAGGEDLARERAASLRAVPLPEPQAYARLVDGEIELRKGNLSDAIRIFHDAQTQVDSWIGRVFLGRAYLEAGQFTEAYSEFESCLKRRGEAAAVFLDDLPSLRLLPQVYYYLGRAQEGLKSQAAKESYRKFLEIKSAAENEPMAADARRRLDNL